MLKPRRPSAGSKETATARFSQPGQSGRNVKFRDMSADQLRVPGIAGPAVPGQAAGRSVRALLAELFPLSADPPARPALAARLASLAVQLAALAAGTLLLLVRISGRPTWDGINTEDVNVFLAQALAHPWHQQSYGGYLELVPRLIGQIVSLLPIRYAAAGFAVSGALIASGCGLLAYHASAPLISSRWLRVLLGLSILLLPVAQLEIADNGVNTPFYLLVALFWAVLWRPRSWAGASVAAVVAFATVASSPLALLFAPLLAARAIVVPHRIRENAVTVGWAIGCLLQVPFIMASHVSRTAHAAPANSVTYLARDVIRPAFGWHLAWQLRASFGRRDADRRRLARRDPGPRGGHAGQAVPGVRGSRGGNRPRVHVRGGRPGCGAGSRRGQRLPLPGEPQQGTRLGADRTNVNTRP